MEIIRVNDFNFLERTKEFDQLIITFSAQWCGKYTLVKPRLKQIARSYKGEVSFFEAFIEDIPKLREKFDVVHLPVTFAFNQGTIVAKTHRLDKASLLSLLKLVSMSAEFNVIVRV